MTKTYPYNDTTQLTAHFNVSEFRCKCGKVHDTLLADELVEKLEQLQPLSEDNFRKRLNDIIASYTKGKDESKLRIVVKRKEN